MAMTRLTIPRMFWDDHAERCCEHPGTRNEISLTKRRVTVELDDDALKDLRSDADYYASPYGPDEPDLRSLRRSAKATLDAINRQTS